ncbi:MAG TPA: cysteine--tRNA ligase [Gemmatimonadales bacterium]|nr:cysteine--tRNA ligase [Gemmatimonadales bacterium]
MTLRLFNTLSRAVEPFAPLAPPGVTLYTCGPTVWNYAHIGNFRTFVFEDVLRRWLECSGYGVTHVMNVTDVDDRTINAAIAAGVRLPEHTAKYLQAFFDDCAYLRLEPATHYPRATEHVPQMVALVERLLARGVAYRGEDGSVYFAIGRFPAYGKLSRIDAREIKVGARVSSDEYAKEDARDFVLWKAAKPEDEAAEAAWDAPFGRGRPGWHLECSAMSQHYLGETIDLHAGGVDLIFPHHEDEIAQSEAASGKPFVRTWLHGEFLLVEGTKMSKRYGNFLTVRDLRDDGWDAAALRLLFASTQYRKQLNFTDEGLRAAEAGAARLGELRRRLARSPAAAGADAAAGAAAPLAPAADRLLAEFTAAMDDDLDTPRALAALMEFVREANAALDAGGGDAADRARAVEIFDRTAGVLQVVGRDAEILPAEPGARLVPGGAAAGPGGPLGPPAAGEDVDAWAARVADERQAARMGKDWARADLARTLLAEQGYEVRDGKDGRPRLLRKRPPTTT